MKDKGTRDTPRLPDHTFQRFGKTTRHSKREHPEELFPFLLSITFLAGHLQRIAEEMVDEYFTPAPDRAETL